MAYAHTHFVEKILQMPYLQLDTPFSYSAEAKQRLAKRLGKIYSEKMNSNINRLDRRYTGTR